MSNIEQIKKLSAELRLYYKSGNDVEPDQAVIRANKIIPILDFIDTLPVESDKVLMPVEPDHDLFKVFNKGLGAGDYNPIVNATDFCNGYKAIVKSIRG